MPDKKGSDDRAYARGFAAGRAAATPDPPDAYTACVEALAEWWTGEATAAEVTGWMNGALQAARLPELDREAAISMCNMVMADLRGECDYGAVVSNVLRAAYPAATPDPPTGHPVKYKHGSPVISDDPAAASPDERLREAEPREAITALLAAARVAGVDARSALRGAPSHTGADLLNALKAEGWVLAAADREKLERICCRGMGADGGCNICAAEATR